MEEKNQAHSKIFRVGTRSRKQTFRKLQRMMQKGVSMQMGVNASLISKQ